MGIYPQPFYSIDWREFDYYVKAELKKEERAWRHTREILASFHNQTLAITSQVAGKKNFEGVTGAEVIPLTGDAPIERRKEKTPGESLAEFKETCLRKGIPWNPKKRAEA